MPEINQVPKELWSGPTAGRLRDIPEPDRLAFRVWLRGTTAPGLSGVSAEEQDAFYLHQYQTWKTGAKHPVQW